MATKVHTVEKARADIYRNGLRVPDNTNKSGWAFDRSKPANDKDVVIVKKGEKYYWFQFKNSPKQISLTYPKRDQLTRSEYQLAIYGFEDRRDDIATYTDPQDFIDNLEELKSDVDDFKSELEDRLSNMPEGLQEGPTGELLQERIDQLESAVDELENIDLNYDEDDYDDKEEYDEADFEEELADMTDEEKENHREEFDAKEEQKKTEHKENWLAERSDELINVQF